MNALAQSIEVKPRQVDFGFDDNLDTYFFDNDAFKTSLIAALSSVFPEGERFFIRSVRNYQDQIKDPVLRQQIRGFIGQEAHHGKQHEEINELFEKLGYEVKLFDRMTKRDMQTLGRLLPKAHQLAVTTGLEHFTAILAHQILSDEKVTEGMDEKVKNLFFWHAVEETEHKAVAYDVFQEVSGSYFIRTLVMLFVSIGFIFGIFGIQCYMLYKKRELFKAKTWKSAWQFLFGKVGLARNLASDYFEYYRPSFHPWDQDNSSIVKNMQTQLSSWAA